MKNSIWLPAVLLGVLFFIAGATAGAAPVIANHTTTHLSDIPLSAITGAKEDLHIAYWHSSHGGQITTGMTGLTTFQNAPYGGSTYAFNAGGTGGALYLTEPQQPMGIDLGTATWPTITRNYLADHPDVNVVMWSWCGQVSTSTSTSIATYLNQMNQLETEYPDVKFVYMTGHLDGSGQQGNLNVRNQQIRNYVLAHNKTLYDFADIESYNPDGVNYLIRNATDACNYDMNNNGRTTQNTAEPPQPTDGDGNWATEWQNGHIQGTDWYSCTAAHTQPLNANRKAYAAWWLWARLGGWTPGNAPVAAFTANATGGTAPLAVRFTDTSSDSPATWNWSFRNVTGNNTVVRFSQARNPAATFGVGNYSISLNASNSAGYSVSAQVTYINVSKAVIVPVAAFTANVTAGTAPLPVRFTDTSSDSPATWNWSFRNVTGNNTVVRFSQARNPTATFGVGNFSISLNASNSAGYSVSAQVTYINVSKAVIVPVAGFTTLSPASGTAPLTVAFTDQSTNTPTSWNWSFGDGSFANASQKNPVHTYASPGTFTVSLNATNSAGSDTVTAAGYITVNPPLPAVTAVAPASGPVAGGTRVTLTGTRFTGATDVRFGTTAGTDLSVDDDTRITVTSPAHPAGIVHITVTAPGGTSTTSAGDQFTFIGSPAFASIDPSSGPTTGGTIVGISGTNFAGGGSLGVTIGGIAATGVSVDSPTRITATTPAGTEGTADVVITNNDGQNVTGAGAFTYVVIPVPSVTAISPAGGSTAGGTRVTLTGTAFTGATAVRFGTTAGTDLVVEGDTQITVSSPAHTAGIVGVTVTTPGGTSVAVAADQFTYSAPPAVTAVSPAGGPAAGGTPVTLTGTGFAGATDVRFGTTASTDISVGSDTQITVTSPAGTGTVDITVTTPDGTSAPSPGDQFTYTGSPTFASINPASGPTAGGTVVGISGTNFAGGGSFGVTIGGIAATGISVDSPTYITATTPAGTEGLADVVITNNDGQTVTGAGAFTYVVLPTPVVTDVSPSGGSTAGGTRVTLTGTGFTGATAVMFGTTAGTDLIVEGDTQITVSSPAHTAGIVDVTVTTPGGTSAAGAADRFTYSAPPAVTAVSPAGGPAAGGTRVTLTGTGFTGATDVRFGTTTGTDLSVEGDTQITVTSPAGTGTVDITVTTPDGTSAPSPEDEFTYTGPPVFTSINPASGPTTGSTIVGISGTNFAGGGSFGVTIGGVAATGVSVDSPTHITATTPAGTEGSADVVVTNNDGQTVTGAGAYTYVAIPVPAVTAISPAGGSTAGCTRVTLTGTGFTGATAVRFGATAGSDLIVDNNTRITVTSPTHAAGIVPITVTTPGGTSPAAPAGRFTYLARPNVTAISPAKGPVAGGTRVSLFGSGFTGETAVRFGTRAGTSMIVNSSNRITVTSPAGTAGTAYVTVITPGGTSPAAPANRFTYLAPPNVTAISPAKGPVTGGTRVTLIGTGFIGATAVRFGTRAGTKMIVNSSNRITVTTPAGTAGSVHVTVTMPGDSGTAPAASRFTYLARPNVTAISPAKGAVTGGTRVTLFGSGFTGATAVRFGARAGTSLVVNSSNRITVTSPAGTAGFVNVAVISPGGSSTVSTASRFTYLVRPNVTAISPAKGPVTGGTRVTLTGTGFTGATAVRFGNRAGTGLVVNSGQSITVTSPSGVAGAVHVTVITPAGSSTASTASRFTYLARPNVTAISPASGSATGGTRVVIAGTGFTGTTAVFFGNQAGTGLTVNSGTLIMITSPPNIAGPAYITVTTPGGTSAASPASQFMYIPPPTVTAISPANGPTTGGTRVTITGTGFSEATAVLFGFQAGTGMIVNSSNRITVTSPSRIAGPVYVTVTTPNGISATSSACQFMYFTY